MLRRVGNEQMKVELEATSEFEKFDAVIRKILAVSKDQLKKREKAWRRKKERAKEKRTLS